MYLLPFCVLVIDQGENRRFMEALYCDAHHAMYVRAYAVLGNAYDADDVVNDACLALMDKIPMLRTLEPRSLRAYAAATAHHTALNHLKRDKRRTKAAIWHIPTDALPGQARTPEDDFILREQVEGALSCLARLQERDQALMEMKYLLDMTDSQIAKALGLAPDSVRVLLGRVRRRLYKMMQEGGLCDE